MNKAARIFRAVFLFIYIFSPFAYIYFDWSDYKLKKIILIILLLFPVSSFAAPSVSGHHAIAIERDSGRILYEKNAYKKTAIASTTKIMTAIIAIENNDLSDIVHISKNAAKTPGSSLDLKEDDAICLKELLYGLMLRSGNDAAVAIAEHTSGNVDEFAKLMNKKAIEIGALSTNFITPHGLDKENHYSTAYDLALISNYALKISLIKEIVSTENYTMAFTDGRTKNMHNTNPLLSAYSGVFGIKTGYTGMAGRCLVAAAEKNDMEIIVVTLGEPSSKLRISDTVKIFEYCFNNYTLTNLCDLYPLNFSLDIGKSTEKAIRPNYKKSLLIPLTKTEKENIIIKKHPYNNLIAPIKKDEPLGKIQFMLNDEILGEIDIVSPIEIRRMSAYIYYYNLLINFLDFNSYIL